jgi:hypothetical protein
LGSPSFGLPRFNGPALISSISRETSNLCVNKYFPACEERPAIGVAFINQAVKSAREAARQLGKQRTCIVYFVGQQA